VDRGRSLALGGCRSTPCSCATCSGSCSAGQGMWCETNIKVALGSLPAGLQFVHVHAKFVHEHRDSPGAERTEGPASYTGDHGPVGTRSAHRYPSAV
jgi:hypothetical protein